MPGRGPRSVTASSTATSVGSASMSAIVTQVRRLRTILRSSTAITAAPPGPSPRPVASSTTSSSVRRSGASISTPDALADQQRVERGRVGVRGPAAGRRRTLDLAVEQRRAPGRRRASAPRAARSARCSASSRSCSTSRPRSSDADPGAQLLDLGEQVAGQEDRGAGRVELAAAGRGSRGCPAGPARWSARPARAAAGVRSRARGQAEPLPHAEGVRPDRPAVDAAEPDLVERVVDPARRGSRAPRRPHRVDQREVRPPRQVRRTPPGPRPARPPRAARSRAAAGIGRPITSIEPEVAQHQPEQHPDGRGLAGAVRPRGSRRRRPRRRPARRPRRRARRRTAW